MKHEFGNNLVFSTKKTTAKTQDINYLIAIERQSISINIHIYFPPSPKYTTFSCGSVCLEPLLRSSPFSAHDFLSLAHCAYSCFTWDHNYCYYNKLSVIYKADAMSRRHLFSFRWVSSSINSAKLLLKLCLFIHISSLVPQETTHLLHPLCKNKICYTLILF